MFGFIKENSYNMVKMLINQFGMTIFGTMLALATAKNDTLLLASSIFATLFYLFLIYSVGWELGAKDKIRVESGRIQSFPAKGFFIALGANIPNLLLAFLMGFGAIISNAFDAKWAGNISIISNAIARLIEGMYLGIIKILEGLFFENPTILDVWWWFIVITFPAMFVGWLSYYLGSRNIRIAALFGIKQNPPKSK